MTVQTDEDIGGTIRQYKEEIAVHKAIAEKAKERYEYAQSEAVKSKEQAVHKEAELTKTLQKQTAKVQEAEKKRPTLLRPYRTLRPHKSTH